MSDKLISSAKLERLTKALNERLETIIVEEKNRAMAVESGLEAMIESKANKDYVDEKLSVVDALTLNGYSIWVGTTSELEAIENRDPNTLYFEIGEDSGDEVVQVDIVNGILQLTDDKYQKTEMVDGTEIVFPDVNKFTEIHLYFNGESNMQLTFPDCKWRVEPSIEEGNFYEIIATYNTMNWLVNVITYS